MNRFRRQQSIQSCRVDNASSFLFPCFRLQVVELRAQDRNTELGLRRPAWRSLPMKIVQLGSQGMAVSAQGLGCMDMSTTYRPSDEQERAVELGVTLFDTAEVYGPFMNDTLLGKAFEGKRDKVAISTKVGFEFTDNGKLAIADGRPVVNGNPVHIRKAVEGSLGRLKTDYIDLPYLHRIDPNTPIDDTDYMGSDRRQFIVTTLVVVGAAAVRNAPGTPSSKIPISQQRRIDGHFYRPCTSTDRVRDVGRPCPIGR
jgi:hypothetical protein